MKGQAAAVAAASVRYLIARHGRSQNRKKVDHRQMAACWMRHYVILIQVVTILIVTISSSTTIVEFTS